MTTREQICRELRKRSYPQTPAMLREKIGKSTVQLLCRCLALEGNLIERRIRGQLWYGTRSDQFKEYRIEYETGAGRGHQWKVLCFQPSERGAMMLAAHAAKHDPQTQYRVIYRSEFVRGVWNNAAQKEKDSWRDGKRTLQVLRRMLRNPSSSRSAASTPEQISPQ